MPQTTGAVSNACARVWISADCEDYTEISGSTQSVTGTEQTRQTGEIYTFDGEGPIVKRGKKEPTDVTFSIVYSDEEAEAYEMARAIFEEAGCGGEICVRWEPDHGTVGTQRLTIFGPITSFTYPAIDASTAAPIAAGFTVRTGNIETEAIAS